MDDLDIGWAKNAKISKLNDDKTIRISKEAVQQFEIRRKIKANSVLNPKRSEIFSAKSNCETASKGNNSAEIMIDEEKEKATLKIGDGKTYDLKVKNENGKLNIYKRKKGAEKKKNEKRKVKSEKSNICNNSIDIVDFGIYGSVNGAAGSGWIR